jgi:hypothetical protein
VVTNSREYTNAYYAKKNAGTSYSRDRHMEKFYGITPARYAEMLEEQNGLCAICNQPPDGNGKNGRVLFIDHDHVSGEVRGLLCRACNGGLGLFKDDPKLLLNAVAYLES